MKNTRKTLFAAVAAMTICSAIVAPDARAILVSPGGLPVAPTIAGNPPPGTFVTSLSSNFNNGLIAGTLNTYLYSGGSLGGYTFVYQIQDSGVGDNITQLSIGFLGITSLTDVSQAPFGGTQQLATDAVRNGSGTINFEFSTLGNLNPGENSYYLIVATNIQSYQFQSVGISDGLTVNVPSIVANVPDSGSMLSLLGLGLLAVEALRRKLTVA